MPRSSLRFDQGDVVLLELPFTDYIGSKLRLVPVVSSNELNSLGEDMIVLKITSKYTFRSFRLS